MRASRLYLAVFEGKKVLVGVWGSVWLGISSNSPLLGKKPFVQDPVNERCSDCRIMPARPEYLQRGLGLGVTARKRTTNAVLR